MPLLDTSLSASTINAAFLLFVDFADLPLRYASSPYPLTVPGGLVDADADCAGFTFETLDSEVIDVGAVEHGENGTQTLTLTLRARADDTELLAAIENPSLYVGRRVRRWFVLHDGAGTVVQISASLGYLGFMSVPTQNVDPESGTLTVTMECENWQAILGGAPSRTYQNQRIYDSGDNSANVSVGGAEAVPGLLNLSGINAEVISRLVQQR